MDPKISRRSLVLGPAACAQWALLRAVPGPALAAAWSGAAPYAQSELGEQIKTRVRPPHHRDRDGVIEGDHGVVRQVHQQLV